MQRSNIEIAAAQIMGCDIEDIEALEDSDYAGMQIFDNGIMQYAIGTEHEANRAAEEFISLVAICPYQAIELNTQTRAHWIKWLAPYDHKEIKVTVDSETFYGYRLN
jgi:hypothetical protein